MTNIVGERFQITIDKAVREALGVQAGDLAYERVEDGRLVVEFIPRPHRRSMLGILHKPGMEPITDWAAVKERAWQARSDEIMEVLRQDSERHRATGAGSDEHDG